MISNRHPVDQLAEVRDLIARLKRQEARLRGEVLNLAQGNTVTGDTHEAVIKQNPRRTFLKDLLPPEILASPDLWRTSSSTYVTVKPRRCGDTVPNPGRAGDDIVLIEEC